MPVPDIGFALLAPDRRCGPRSASYFFSPPSRRGDRTAGSCSGSCGPWWRSPPAGLDPDGRL